MIDLICLVGLVVEWCGRPSSDIVKKIYIFYLRELKKSLQKKISFLGELHI